MHIINTVITFIFLITCLAHSTHASEPTPMGRENPIVVLESPYDFATTIKNIKASIVGKNFRLIREQKLDHGLVARDQENPNQHIIYFCNFSFLNKALAAESHAGLFLPYRVTVVKMNNKVYIYTVNPKYLANRLENSNLDLFRTKMGDAYLDIIEEAII